MKVYCHPASTTSRPIMLFVLENGIKADFQVIDLFTGEHYKPPYEAINPNRLVPVLEDDGFILTESSAILKYLADKIDSPAYPKDLQQRARVNERMDWINTQMCRDLAYGFVYPQIFPMHKRQSDEAQEATLAWGKERAQGWFKILNDHMLAGKNQYLCGEKITIADYFGVSFIALAEVVRSDFGSYPNVKAWVDRMKGLKSWKQVYETIDGYAASLKDAPMQTV